MAWWGELEATQLSLNAMAALGDAVPHMLWMADPSGRADYFNDAALRFTGLDRSHLVEDGWLSVIHGDDRLGAQARWSAAVASGEGYELEYRVRRWDGEFRRLQERSQPVRAADGTVVRWVGTWSDVEDERRAHDQVTAAEARATEVLALIDATQEAAPVAFGFIDRELRIVRVNATMAALNGLDPIRDMGRRVAEVVPDMWPVFEPRYRSVLDTGQPVSVLEQIEGSPGTKRSFWLTNYFPVIVEDEIIGIGITGADITETKQAEDFRRVITDTMAEGLYALDRDGLVSFMNASAARMLGWSEDELCGKCAHEVIHYQRADGTPLPEDECALLAVRTEGRTVRMGEDAFTRRDGTIMPVAYSAAPVLDGTRVEGAVVVFRDASLEKADRQRARRDLDALTWLGRIRDALDNDHLVLYTQPIVPLRGGQASEELLLRMMSPAGDVIPPGSFLPIAEKYGLVADIDLWVLDQAIARAATGRHVELNLSAWTIANVDLMPTIERLLHDRGCDPRLLVFEITETALMSDLDAGIAFARAVNDIGCAVALDDFGTGYASFTYLKTLPIRYLKIDIEFVRDLPTSPANRHVVDAIVSLARGFGQQTIAEGVEDEASLRILAAAGVDFAQGYHLGRPTPMGS